MTASTNHVLSQRLMNHRPLRKALIILLLVCLLLGLIIVPIEQADPSRKILTSEEGLWWAITTATGVGYGDFVPVTTLGRVVGAVLQFGGVIMFGLIIGIIGITLNKRQEEYYWFRLFDRLNQLELQIQNLEKETKFLILSEKNQEKNHE